MLFGFPDMSAEVTHAAVEVPQLGSILLTHSLHGQIPALKDFPKEDRPNSSIVFWTFRVMAGLGFLMVLLGLWSAWLRIRRRLFDSKLFLRLAVLMGPAGLVALLAGWMTTEIGRQPWVVYGLLRTENAVSNHSAATVSATLAIFVVMYVFVFGTGISYMLKLIAKGPHGIRPQEHSEPGQVKRAARPLSAAPDNIDPAISK